MDATHRLAFDDLVRRALPGLVRAADLMTGDPASADDVVVDALVSVYRRWPGLPASRDPREALRRELTGACVRRQRDRPLARQPSLALADEPAAERDPRAASDPVWEALLDLSSQARAVLVWRIFEQLPNRALARAVGRPVLVTDRLARRAVEQVGLTVGPIGCDDISDLRDSAVLARLESAIDVSMARHHRADVDVDGLLDRAHERLAGVRQRRRPQRRPLAVAAVLTMLAAGGAVLGWSERTKEPAVSTAAGRDAPAGTRLVGYRSLAVSVPAGWGRDLSGCGRGSRDTVVYPDAQPPSTDSSCLPARDRDRSSVTFSDSASDLFGVPPRVIGEVDGHVVLATELRHRAGFYERAVLVPVAQFSMLVRSQDQHLLEQIVASVQRIPDGYTLVPMCERLPLREAIRRLGEAGLRVEITQASRLSEKYGQPPVTTQSIRAGQLVEEETVVGLGFPSF